MRGGTSIMEDGGGGYFNNGGWVGGGGRDFKKGRWGWGRGTSIMVGGGRGFNNGGRGGGGGDHGMHAHIYATCFFLKLFQKGPKLSQYVEGIAHMANIFETWR